MVFESAQPSTLRECRSITAHRECVAAGHRHVGDVGAPDLVGTVSTV